MGVEAATMLSRLAAPSGEAASGKTASDVFVW
jgi:hypothetical protein